MATKPSSSWSPCITFIEESLLLPTQNIRLFASTFLLIFIHTILFLAVAVLYAHPLTVSVLVDIETLSFTNTASYSYTILVDRITEHARKLIVIFLAYLASKLSVQVVAVLAATTTYYGERRSFTELLRCKLVKEKIRGPFLTGAFVGMLELTSTTLLVVLLVSLWSDTESGMVNFSRYLMFLIALLLYIYLGAVFVVGVAVSAVDEDCSGPLAMRRAWRLIRKSRREETAVLVIVANLMPVVIYPVYMSALYSEALWLSGVLFGFVLPSVGAQLFSMVAATMFYCQSMEVNEGVQF